MEFLKMVLKFIRGPKTVDGVMSAFNKSLNELKEVEDDHSKEARRQVEIAEAANKASAAALAEAEKAKDVAQRMRAIYNPA